MPVSTVNILHFFIVTFISMLEWYFFSLEKIGLMDIILTNYLEFKIKYKSAFGGNKLLLFSRFKPCIYKMTKHIFTFIPCLKLSV